jgi:anthranilate synthase/aminodeoxychorismate synthase-like glutamine amidotransferase
MPDATRIVLVDNLDSFTWSLADEFSRRGAEVEVWRNDADAAQLLSRARGRGPGLLVLSPGPGAPAEAGCCTELVRRAERERVPLFGVCLGLQVLVEALGGSVAGAREIVHGRASCVEHDGDPLFEGVPSPFRAGRYHSLAAAALPDCLLPIAHFDGVVMAARHRRAPLAGVQYHPESILTPDGGRLIENVLRWARHAAG